MYVVSIADCSFTWYVVKNPIAYWLLMCMLTVYYFVCVVARKLLTCELRYWMNRYVAVNRISTDVAAIRCS